MTTMKNSLYALVAVLAGVMLVGLLPGQLSNLASPTVSLQANDLLGHNITITGSGSTTKGYNDTLTQAEQEAALTASEAQSRADDGATFVLAGDTTNPYADLIYYGMMCVGLVVALGVYFAARRMLG